MNDPLRASEVGVVLGVSARTVRRMVAAEELPAIRVSRRGDLRFRRSDIERFLRKREVGGEE